MEVEKINSLTSPKFGENFTLASNSSFEDRLSMEEEEEEGEEEGRYSYDTSVRIVMLSVLLAAALVGNSLAFHTLVTNRSED